MRRFAGNDRTWARLTELLTVALAGWLALRAPGMGDYPFDAGPSLTAIAHGSVGGFFSHQPVMGAVSLYLRAPFVALGATLHDGPVGLYRWGDLPCLLSVALLAIWLGRFARRRLERAGHAGWALPMQVLIAAICLLGPFTNNALYYGHPEELLTASLAIGGLLAACEQRSVPGAVLLGLAVASKQWALVAIPPAILVLDRQRLRALLIVAATAGLATLPMIVGNPTAFGNALHSASSSPSVVTEFTWLYPFSPAGLVKLVSIFGDARVLAAHRMVGIEALARPAITALGLGVPLLVWWRSGRRLSGEQALLCAALVLLLRCVLDPGSEPYYHFPVVAAVLALDVWAGRRVPVLGMTAVALSYVLDRFWVYGSQALINGTYILASVTVCGLLVWALCATLVPPGEPRRGGERALPAQHISPA